MMKSLTFALVLCHLIVGSSLAFSISHRLGFAVVPPTTTTTTTKQPEVTASSHDVTLLDLRHADNQQEKLRTSLLHNLEPLSYREESTSSKIQQKNGMKTNDKGNDKNVANKFTLSGLLFSLRQHGLLKTRRENAKVFNF